MVQMYSWWSPETMLFIKRKSTLYNICLKSHFKKIKACTMGMHLNPKMITLNTFEPF